MDLAKLVEKERTQEEGVWRVLNIEGKPVGKVLVTALSNLAFAEEVEKEMLKYRRRNNISQKKELTTTQTIEVMTLCMAKKVLKGWAPLDNEGAEEFPVLNGELLDNTLDNRLRLLSIWTVRSAIQDLALELGEATCEDLEGDRLK